MIADLVQLWLRSTSGGVDRQVHGNLPLQEPGFLRLCHPLLLSEDFEEQGKIDAMHLARRLAIRLQRSAELAYVEEVELDVPVRLLRTCSVINHRIVHLCSLTLDVCQIR